MPTKSNTSKTTRAKPVTTGRAKTFTIDRSKWMQGGVHKRKIGKLTQLRSPDGMKCCLGFYAIACGARGVTDVNSPCELDDTEYPKLDLKFIRTDDYGSHDTEMSCDLMLTNDNTSLSDTRREAIVTSKFAKLGITVKFKGKYPYAK